MAYKSSPRGTRPVIWVAGHSAEGARTARALGNFFWRDDIMASSHVGIDSRETLAYVPYSRAAWTMRAANPISDQAEVCGFARWTRSQWLSTDVVDGVEAPAIMVARFADWVRARCIARLIPIRKLMTAQVAAGQAGVISHADYTQATGDGTHWDPGPGFPWDLVIQRAAGGSVSDAEVTEIARMLWKGGNVPGDVAAGTLIAVAREIKAMAWGGGAVPGEVAPGTLVDVVRTTATDLEAVATEVDEVKVIVQAIMDKLNETPPA